MIAGFGWRAIYVLLACGGAILLAITWFFLAESRKTHARRADIPLGRPGKTTNDPVFVLLCLVNALSYGAVFAYIAGSPFLVIDYYGGSPTTYSEVFACTAIALTLGAWTAARLGRRGVSADTLVRTGLTISAAASCGLALSCLASRAISAPAAFAFLVVIIFCRGGISPNLQHLAIERQRERSGAASAVVGILQLSFGTFSSVVVSGLLGGFGPFAVAGPMMFFACAAASAWRWMKWREHRGRIRSPA